MSQKKKNLMDRWSPSEINYWCYYIKDVKPHAIWVRLKNICEIIISHPGVSWHGAMREDMESPSATCRAVLKYIHDALPIYVMSWQDTMRWRCRSDWVWSPRSPVASELLIWRNWGEPPRRNARRIGNYEETDIERGVVCDEIGAPIVAPCH